MVEVLGATLNEERSAEQVPNKQCQTAAKLQTWLHAFRDRERDPTTHACVMKTCVHSNKLTPHVNNSLNFVPLRSLVCTVFEYTHQLNHSRGPAYPSSTLPSLTTPSPPQWRCRCAGLDSEPHPDSLHECTGWWCPVENVLNRFSDLCQMSNSG